MYTCTCIGSQNTWVLGWVGHYTWMGWTKYLDGLVITPGWVGHYTWMGITKIPRSLDGLAIICTWMGWTKYLYGLVITPGWVGHYTWMGIAKIPGSLDGLALFVPWQELDGNLLPDFCLISVTG